MSNEENKKISVVLNVMLLKDNCVFEQPETYIKDYSEDNVRYNDSELILYKKNRVLSNPSWYELFSEKVWDDRADVDINKTSSEGLSLIKKVSRNNENYIFILNFNTGRYNIEPKMINKKFGLYTAQKMILNGNARLKNTSIRSLEENPINKNVAFGEEIDSGIYQANLDPNDYVRELNINISNSAYFKKMIGKNGSLNVRILFEEEEIPCISHIDAKLFDLIDIYNSITQDEINLLFKGLRPLEEEDCDELYEVLDIRIQNFRETREGFYLFEPESDFDFSRVQKYEFKINTVIGGKNRRINHECEEFKLEKYLELQPNLSLENFKNDSIRFVDENDYGKEWSIFECLYGEMEHENRVYVLSTEKWFEIEKDKFERINQDIQRIEDNEFVVEESVKQDTSKKIRIKKIEVGESGRIDKERIFNRELCANKSGELLDEISKQIKLEGDKFEVCDIYLPHNKEFIHSKIKSGSSASALGHLFNQAYVSGYSFMRFKDNFIKKTNEKINQSKNYLSGDHKDYTIRLLIINAGNNNKLTFFSKLILDEKRAQLEGFGYKVKLTWVNGVNLNPNID